MLSCTISKDPQIYYSSSSWPHHLLMSAQFPWINLNETVSNWECRYEFCVRNALSESSLMVFAPHCELHLYFIKIYIFSQHQPQVFTNIGKANVTKHKSGTKLSTTICKDYVQGTDGC